MQLILFVELCSEMSSRMIFWPNKSIFTLIWIPSKYTQMSINPNHYLEPCRNFFKTPLIRLLFAFCYDITKPLNPAVRLKNYPNTMNFAKESYFELLYRCALKKTENDTQKCDLPLFSIFPYCFPLSKTQ